MTIISVFAFIDFLHRYTFRRITIVFDHQAFILHVGLRFVGEIELIGIPVQDLNAGGMSVGNNRFGEMSLI